jgi:flavin-dependent dehydrogenase
MKTDLVIVGGGPAGLATAIAAAGRGVDVLLLDHQAPDAEQPGETLPPGAEALLRELGVLSEVEAAAPVRHDGHWHKQAGERRFARFGADVNGPWRGYQICRSTLRCILRQRADSLGVMMHSARALRPILDGAAIVGVETSDGAMASHLLVDASGTSHWLARARDETIEIASPRLIAWYGWAASSRASTYARPVLETNGTGWSWIAQIDDGLCAWVRLDRSGGARRLAMPRALRGFEPIGRPRGADVTWRIAPHQGGDGFLRVGDAGALLDPSSSHGVLRALMTGQAAAHLANRILRQGVAWEPEVAAYDRWIRSAFLRDMAALRTLYGHRSVVRRGPVALAWLSA